MAEEIVTLRVRTEGDQNALRSLEALDKLVKKLNRTPVNINVKGLENLERAAKKSASSAEQSIEAFQSAASTASRGAEELTEQTHDLIEMQMDYEALWSAMKRFFIQTFIKHLEDATNELKAMNAEMVSIQKVTGATGADMERLKNSAFEVAGALGSTPSDYLSSVTKWAQAGYGALSDQLGELSAKTQVVGDVNEETANKFLLAVDAAYKYKGNIDALTRVLDGANEISNNYATSVEKLAGGMGIVSSLAEQAGMKVEETMAAIGAITAKTQESGNSAARALRALILNIQGSTEVEIDAETGERWTEDEIQRTAAALGKLNVATREYKDGMMSLRNPMEVIGELAEKYQKGLVTEAQLQEVVASLGGKVRSNQLMALIQGYETYTSMIETYKDAVGSADKELEIYLNGWEAKSNRLMNQWTEFVESFQASDISMGLLDMGSALLKIADTSAGQIIALAAAMVTLNIALKAFAQTEGGIAAAQVLSGFKTLGSDMLMAARSAAMAAGGLTTLKGATLGAAAATKALGAAIHSAMGPVGMVVVGIFALVKIIDLLTVTAKEQAQATADAMAEYEKEKAALEGLEDQLKTTQDRIDELNSKDSPTVVEREELDKLEKQNRRLERQIKLQERLAEVKKKAAEAETKKSLDKGYTGANYNYQPWRDNFTGTPSITKENIEYELGQLKGFEEQGKFLIETLNGLENAKQKFLSDNGKQSGWSEQTIKNFNEIETQIETVGNIATEFQDEMEGLIDNLPEGPDKDKWDGLAEDLYAAANPAEALTEKLTRLVDAMDEAERSRFAEELERIQADGEVTAQEVQTLIDKFPALKPLLEGNAGALDTLAQHFTESAAAAQEAENGIDGVGNAAENTESDIDTLVTTLKTAVSGMKEIKDAQDELKNNGRLSVNNLTALLGKYGGAMDSVILKAMAGLATQEEISEALQEAYQKEADTYRKVILQKEMDNEDFYSSWLDANADAVNKLLTQYGVDARNYKTFAQLREAIETGTQKDLTSMEQGGANDRAKIFQSIQTAFANTQDAMLKKAGEAVGAISRMYSMLGGLMGGIAKGLAGPVSSLAGPAVDKLSEVKQNQLDQAMQEILDSFQVPDLGGLKGSSKSGGGSGKNWYEIQTDNLNKLVEQTKRTNQVLEQSDQDTARKRIDNLKNVQEKILAAQKQFIAKGKAETSDEVNQLKIMYAGLGDDIRDIYSSMTDDILEQHDYLIWTFEKKGENPRSMAAMAQDDADMVQQYRKMQEEVHKQAEYYRSQGIRENDKLIRDLQDKWWEYEKAIRSMYDNLTDAFNDYIDESSHKIEELGRTPGNVGKQIEIYAERIRKAQETIAALQANNINGANNGAIFDMESQIWGDKDSIRDLQEGLWDELERAFDDIFDKAQDDIDSVGDEIDEIQDRMDDINDILEEYDKELEGILKPINDTLKKLNDQLEAEKKRLEALTDPLNERKNALEDQIKGYYTINPDGSIGPYIKGLDDSLEEIQDQIDKANEELDRVNDAWDEQKDREEEALALQKKQLAVEEAQKAVEEAMLALQTARNERNIYTLKDGVWAWRADEEAVAKAEKALAEAEKAKEEAEKELQDYKEEQAHKQIVNRLEEQIKALEEQKKLLDKQKDLINKQIDAISKQVAAYEKESQARQDYIQDLIDQKEEEKKAWEDHYEALKEQYSDQIDMLEAEKKAAEERKKQAEKQYEDWMDAWRDIQKSIETPARDLSEILNDIARYGTPAMADQVDRVTDLLRDLGYAIEDVTSGGGYDPDDGWNGGSGGQEGMSRQEIIDRMISNAYAWGAASSEAERNDLLQENKRLGAMIGANYNPASGEWDIFDYSDGHITVKPWAYGDNYSGYSSQGLSAPSLYSLENDSYSSYKREYGLLSTYDLQPVRPPIAPGYNPATNTYDDHSITMNGVTIGSSMLQRPLSDTLGLIGLNMGT